jgi:hypothetical protein
MTKPLSSLLLLMACAGLLGAETNSLVPFQSLGEGQKPYTGEIRPGPITSEIAWASLWAQYTGQTNYPSVDFTRDMVLPLTALMPAQGYRIGVARRRSPDQSGAHLGLSFRGPPAMRPAVDG